jgi:hypothetical protein
VIITVSKPLEEICESLKGFQKVFIVGCAQCATKCRTGSEDQAKKLLEDLSAKGKNVSGFKVLDTPCDIRVAKKDLGRVSQASGADVILVLACGGGVQTVEKVLGRPTIPGLNPVFIGVTERIGVYQEYCKACGHCFLDMTLGICPVTRCAKGLVNGPCGGVIDGKCEADLERDCVWVLILEKLKKENRLERVLKDFIAPRSFSKPHNIKNK